MSSRRLDDPLESRSRFRTKRVVQDGNGWYFLTREGTIEGPFRTEKDAKEQLDMYVRMAIHDMLPEPSNLSLVE
jgi:hypothetical protein